MALPRPRRLAPRHRRPQRRRRLLDRPARRPRARRRHHARRDPQPLHRARTRAWHGPMGQPMTVLVELLDRWQAVKRETMDGTEDPDQLIRGDGAGYLAAAAGLDEG